MPPRQKRKVSTRSSSVSSRESASKRRSASIASTTSEYGNMTVREYLTKCLNEAVEKVDAHGKKAIEKFHAEADKAKKTLETYMIETEDKGESEEVEDKEEPLKYIVKVKCTKGYYSGQEFKINLSIEDNPICYIGRSSGKKYKLPKGLSLPKDPEVSTTHAELRLSTDGKITITDVNSTNGTIINGTTIKPRKAHLLTTDTPTEMSIGSSELTITFERA
ncbi:hypothetical protein THRCLA_20335 [Thraustotheca clavata]|uniref:FHA domain-containing protein n=1 Tax=Thraustotheca clavata TaxID=74557 RepID=A0A1W0A8L0_9STRA|nr:hypothetical protein THRCLA_20335 [Thraustotheca clavata]